MAARGARTAASQVTDEHPGGPSAMLAAAATRQALSATISAALFDRHAACASDQREFSPSFRSNEVCENDDMPGRLVFRTSADGTQTPAERLWGGLRCTKASTLRGLVPLSGGGTANFLRADGTWARRHQG